MPLSLPLCLIACLEAQPGLLVPKPLGLNPFDGIQGGVRRLPPPTLQRFSICHGHTCRFVSEASFSVAQWDRIANALVGGSVSASAERLLIPKIIGMMETIVGPQTGTSGDRAENQAQSSNSGQMDCIDESSNTLTYLTLLADNELLRWHSVGTRLNRGPYTLVMQAPHSAAEMIEVANGERFAVDSWFGANGQPALVVSQSAWARGFRPAWQKVRKPPSTRVVREVEDKPSGW